jgi:membrane-associated phospholipid phosphatase
MKSKSLEFIIFISLTLSYILLSILVNKDIFRMFDYESMLLVQKYTSSVVDKLFSFFTLLGSSEISLLIIVMIFIYIAIRIKKYFFAIFLYIFIYIIEIYSKLHIYHPIPPVNLNRYVFDFHFPSAFVVKTNYSFPSGHMARISFIMAILFYLNSKLRNPFKKYNNIIIILTLLIMFISRIYLGEHWFSDCLGGMFLGFIVARMSILLW